MQAYCDNPELSSVLHFVENPGTISQRNLNKANLNANYCQALRPSHIKLENGILIYCKPIAGSESYAHLQLVPTVFWNIIFVAFHSNPIGGHLNVFCTLHRIRLRFYWPGMFLYINKTCTSCPGCALPNQPVANQRSFYITSPSKLCFWFYTLMGTRLARNRDLNTPPTILWHAVVRAHLP